MAALSAAELGEEVAERRPAPLTARRTALLVALGGALGAVLRYLLQLALPPTITPTVVATPWSTWAANLIGCLGVGLITGIIETHPRAPAWLEPFVVVGLCGSFTVMSVVVLQVSAMIGASFPLLSLEYSLLTALAALAAVVLGIAVGRVVGKRVRA